MIAYACLSSFVARLDLSPSNLGGALNPYREWLGIQTESTPSSHYELLGLPLFEADPQQIRAAYDARRGQVSRCVKTEQEGKLATALLRELSTALACLSSPQAKTAYDAQLRQGVSREDAAGPQSAAPPSPGVTQARRTSPQPSSASPPVVSISRTDSANPTSVTASAKTAPARKSPQNMSIEIVKIVVGGAVGLGIASVLLLFLGVNPFGDPQPGPQRVDQREGQRDRGGVPTPVDALPDRPTPSVDDPFVLIASENASDRSEASLAPSTLSEVASATTDAESSQLAKRVAWAPEYSRDDVVGRREQLAVACRQVQPMLTNPASLSEAEKTALSIEFIRALQLFAEELTFCVATEAELEGTLSSLTESMVSITDTPPKRRILAEIANSIVKAGDRARHGVLLLGVVEEMQLVDGLYKTTLRIQSRTADKISLWSWHDPAQDCQVGAVVVSFAVLVDAPAENLSGYTGTENTVAWTRHLRTLSP